MDEITRNLIKENLHLAYEVDALRAAVSMYQKFSSVMAKLLDKQGVPLSGEEYNRINDEYLARMKIVEEAFEMNQTLFRLSVGMRTGDTSFGMRTGKVTEEDVNRILSDIDPEIVKKMGE